MKRPTTARANSPSITSRTLKQTLDWLSTITPSPYYSGGDDGKKYLWEYTPLRFEGCNLTFNNRWHLQEGPSWVFNTVSLTDLKEDEIRLEHQGTGVGLRLNTYEYRFKRKDTGGFFSVSIGTYYVNFGDAETSLRVSKALAHAIKLCKARKETVAASGQ